VSLPIDTITVVDSKTFTIQYSALDYRYNWLHLLTLLPAHVEGSVFANAPNEWLQRTRYEQNKLDPGLYNGAYRIAEQGSTMLQLDRNVAWWGQPPYFERIILKTYPTSEGVSTAFTKGDIDMVAGQARLPLSTLIPESHRRLITVNQFFEHMDINVEHPALQDVRVRQALLYGIDRDALNTITYDGQYHVAASLLHPLDGMLSRDIAQYDYNPTKASVLLDEAGWMRGADGRRAKAGQPLQITLTTTADDSARALIQQTVQYYWRQLGVDVTVEVHAPDVFFSDILPKRAFSGVALYAWTASPESVPVTMLHSEHIPSPDNGWRGQNYGGYRDSDMDATLQQLVQSVDTPIKLELWQNVQERYMASLPSLPLFFMADMDIVPFELRGFEPTGHDFPPSLWSEFWLRARDEGR
jgi:peptide/nickel transport system substrate-binding protein